MGSGAGLQKSTIGRIVLRSRGEIFELVSTPRCWQTTIYWSNHGVAYVLGSAQKCSRPGCAWARTPSIRPRMRLRASSSARKQSVMNAETEQAILPERRILKGAQLLADPKFDHGRKDLTLKELQQFGIMTGWAAVVRGLTNELRAGDRFLGGTDGKATIRLSHQESFSKSQVVTGWDDLWELFEVCRWMSARSEARSEVFGAGSA